VKVHDQKALAVRTQDIATALDLAAAQIRDGNFGGAYSRLFDVHRELDKITFEVVKELGAIEERSR
jgi:Flp pilus assembly protein TadD